MIEIGGPYRVRCEIVRQVRQPALIEQRSVRGITARAIVEHAHPGRRPPRTCSRRTVLGDDGHPASREVVGERRIGDTVVARDIRCADGLDLLGRLGSLERALRIQDRADRLPSDDATSREATSVANAIDLVPNRLLMIAAADEVRTNRVGQVLGFDRDRRGTKRLGHDLPAIEPSPRILRSLSDEGIGLYSLKWGVSLV